MDAVWKTMNDYLPKTKEEWNWWIKFRKADVILKKHDSFLYCEIAFYVMAFLTFIHAMRYGGRFRWLWLASVFHGLTMECVSYFVPDINNYWHAQSSVMLLGQRLPLHILFMYPVYYYVASVAVGHMKLRGWAEPFAVGLSVVILDVPYGIMGIKLLWWTWHDDDPNIYDRHYSVPWTSYYFNATFAAGFTMVFHGLRNCLCQRANKFQSAGFLLELMVAVTTGLLAMPLGVLQFLPIYHPLHDSFKLHTEVCVLMLLGVYSILVWIADRTPLEGARGPQKSRGAISEVFLCVLLHYGLYLYLVFTAMPEKIQSTGFHQPVGNCNTTLPVQTPFGMTLSKHKYLCLSKYDEDVFDFHCVKKQPPSGKDWYTICGTEFPNHAEYTFVVTSFCVLGLVWYWQLLFRSGAVPSTQGPKPKQHKD
ncbi:uncharacterized protein LOC124277179 [Haliotis rubra]|uniref:uncharacterized protein LOC124277179 n=1 Tax=Haliotis rubra TaxID=36100 RepID=UPI001EE573AE|nr:uncharacterized protein LOC124277179 [Haliotis rubra]